MATITFEKYPMYIEKVPKRKMQQIIKKELSTKYSLPNTREIETFLSFLTENFYEEIFEYFESEMKQMFQETMKEEIYEVKI